MPDGRITQIEAGLQSRPYKGRQALYRFLREDHAGFLAMFERTDPSWRTVAEELAKAGVMGATGNPPTRESIRRVWIRVCRDVATEKAAADMERLTGIRPANGQRRLPANWLPSGFAQPNAPPPSGGVHQGNRQAALPAALPLQLASPPAAEVSRDSSRPAPGSLAAVRERLNLLSGRKANGDPTY